MNYWNPGDWVVWRSRPQGQVGYVIPATVVIDTGEVTVLYQATGSVCKRRSGRRGGPRGRNMLDGWDGTYEDAVWSGAPTLRLHRWGTAHSIIRSWSAVSDQAEGWYINLEQAWRRTPIGFDSKDLVLDITLAPDLSSWAWKDEDELAWSVEVGTYTAEEASAIRAEGLRVIVALERREWPFDDSWAAWRPDPRWPIPTVPENWADLSL